MKTVNQVVQVVEIRKPDNPRASQGHQLAQRVPSQVLSLGNAVLIKSAEYWLKLGEADQALRELEGLPQDTWNHPAALKARVAAIGALRGISEARTED